MKRWCIVFALAAFGCGAFCSCGKSDAVEETSEGTTEDPVEETEEKSKISFEFEGEYSGENDEVIIYDYYDTLGGSDGTLRILGIVADGADDPYVHFPAGRYCISDMSFTITKEIDGVSDYTFKVNYQSGSITEVRETRPSIKYKRVGIHPAAGRQGVCTDHDHYWVSGSGTLSKYDRGRRHAIWEITVILKSRTIF